MELKSKTVSFAPHNTDFSGKDLSGKSMCEASLGQCVFKDVNFKNADLRGANFTGCDFRGADFSCASLDHANFIHADLRSSILTHTSLWNTSFFGANLTDTVLDPTNKPNVGVDGLERDGLFVIGYRSRITHHIREYIDGRTYTADVFSTCNLTDCHPGLYFWNTHTMAQFWNGSYVDIIKVRIDAKDIHKVGNKWRCRKFTVIGSV